VDISIFQNEIKTDSCPEWHSFKNLVKSSIAENQKNTGISA